MPDVTVNVYWNDGPQVSVDPIDVGDKKNATITWTVGEDIEWFMIANLMEPSKNSQFDRVKPEVCYKSDESCYTKDKNDDDADYEYKVVASNGTEIKVLDPTIRNRGGGDEMGKNDNAEAASDSGEAAGDADSGGEGVGEGEDNPEDSF